MAYVIAEPCIGTKDTACVDACPVDCIHPKKDSEKHAAETMLYIDPVECIDCGACAPECAQPTSRRLRVLLSVIFVDLDAKNPSQPQRSQR
jgi:NAD-dependent dihydropyrimidine dehydrogenase PreA subunit